MFERLQIEQYVKKQHIPCAISSDKGKTNFVFERCYFSITQFD